MVSSYPNISLIQCVCIADFLLYIKLYATGNYEAPPFGTSAAVNTYFV